MRDLRDIKYMLEQPSSCGWFIEEGTRLYALTPKGSLTCFFGDFTGWSTNNIKSYLAEATNLSAPQDPDEFLTEVIIHRIDTRLHDYMKAVTRDHNITELSFLYGVLDAVNGMRVNDNVKQAVQAKLHEYRSRVTQSISRKLLEGLVEPS
jgi:hypothetical protein